MKPRNQDGFNRRRKLQRKRTLKLATWNVQGLRTKQSEVFKELQKMKVDICILTETKKKGRGTETIGDYIHIYSGVKKDTRAKRGVSIAIHKTLKKSIKSWEEIDEQIIKLELEKNGRQIVILGIYAPSDQSEVLLKDQFYQKLADLLAGIKNGKELFLLGDFNARTGKEQNSLEVGKYGEQITNENGTRLIELCQTFSMKIMNGFFPHKNIHKYTWVQPTRGLQSIIDYVIQRKNSKLQITDIRVHRGPECGTDHYMLVANVIVSYRRLINTKQSSTENDAINTETYKYNLESLRHDTTQFLYKLRMAAKLQAVERNRPAREVYNKVKCIIHEAANEALGKIEKQNSNPEWWSEKMGELIKKKKHAYEIWLQSNSTDDRRNYSYLNREVKKEVKKSKNEMWDRKCEYLERCLGGTQVSEAWKTIKSLRRDEKNMSRLEIISMGEWENYYKTLLTETREKFNSKIQVENNPRSQVERITLEELRKALKESKNKKSAGPGGIPIELIKYGPDILLEIVADIFNKCLIDGDNIPDDWNISYVSSIYKKGDRRSCENYRGISVVSAMGRLYGKVLKKRIEKEVEEIEDQSGFRAGRSCLDNIFVLQQVMERRKERNLPTHIVFIDLEKAYDTVPLNKLFETLTKNGINKTYVRAVWNMYRECKSAVKWGNMISEAFPITKGLKQGCTLSPTLFKIYIQQVLNNWRKKVSGMGISIDDDNNLTNLLFADDQVIFACDEEDTDYMLRKLDEEYKKWGLNINLNKTEYMRIRESQDVDPELEINKKISRCTEYKYLGFVITEEGNTKGAMQYRLQQGRTAIRLMNSLLWSNNLKLNTKISLYKTIVEPIMSYGSECWQLTKKGKKTIETVEMDYMRRACQISKMEHIPNQEIRRRTGRIHTSADRIETRQLIWYGHVMRMEEHRWPMRALKYLPPNRRKRGRPEVSWKQGISQIMEDRAIPEDAWRDREGWKSKCGMRQRL